MKVYKTVRGLQNFLDKQRKAGKKIGFVPTMGALHMGHMSLIEKSESENDLTVCSIFVNPTQFNDKDDLIKYPRTLKKDAILLKTHGCDVILSPSIKQVYPSGENKTIDLDITSLTKHMEGPNRPGHFEGMIQVVHRLLEIVQPDNLYMGQKDFQQFSIVAYMLKTLNIKTKLRVCPIIREKDGLAMSSRNVRLKPSIRERSTVLYETLNEVKKNLTKISPNKLEKKALDKMSIKDFEPEYLKIVDGFTLEPIKDPSNHDYIVVCTAVWAGDVRLIDNMILKQEG